MDQRYKLLTRLAACAPRALAESHTPALRELHDGAVAVGLTGRLPVAAAAKARLHALFDVALEHGLVAVITHFVQEVVMDTLAVSHDEESAQLLDGEHVMEWVQNVHARTRGALDPTSANPNRAEAASASLIDASLVKLDGLLHVLHALTATWGGQLQQVMAETQQVTLLHQYAEVMAWCAHSAPLRRGYGRHSGMAGWKGSMDQRRAAMKPLPSLFVDDWWAQLRRPRDFYPPESAEALAKTLLWDAGELSAAVDGAVEAHTLKKHLLLYYLLDLSPPAEEDSVAGHESWALVQSFQAALRLPAHEVAAVHATLLLDSHVPADVQRACRMLPLLADPTMPFKVVEVLHAKGQRTVALQVLRVLSRAPPPSPDTPLAKLQQEGEAGLCVRLSCGLLPEAFMALREHCARAPPALRPACVAFLMRRLAEECARCDQLEWLVALPLSPPEEAAVIGWLETQDVAAEFVPLFYLHRARYVESAGAAATLPACTTLPGAAELREVVAAHAVALLPEVQRRLVLQEPTTTPSAGVAAPLQVVKSGALNSEGVGGDWRLEVRPWGLHPPPLYTTLGSGTAPTTPPQMHTTAATMAANAANAPPPAQPTPIPSTPARTPATAATGRYRAPPPSMDAQLAGLPPTPLSAADGEGSDDDDAVLNSWLKASAPGNTLSGNKRPRVLRSTRRR